MFLYLYYKYVLSVLYWYSMAISSFYQNNYNKNNKNSNNHHNNKNNKEKQQQKLNVCLGSSRTIGIYNLNESEESEKNNERGVKKGRKWKAKRANTTKKTDRKRNRRQDESRNRIRDFQIDFVISRFSDEGLRGRMLESGFACVCACVCVLVTRRGSSYTDWTIRCDIRIRIN